MSGEALQRRGYRTGLGVHPASLSESVAAGILVMAGCKPGEHPPGVLADPMCGSGAICSNPWFHEAPLAHCLILFDGTLLMFHALDSWMAHCCPFLSCLVLLRARSLMFLVQVIDHLLLSCASDRTRETLSA